NPGREVPPGVPAILKEAMAEDGSAGVLPFSAVPAAEKPKSSGRRTGLANWLTAPDQPMVTRLLVNRLWQHHFGMGLVSTPDNFGLTGSRPTHPELLDWLATELVRTGWSVKALHRLIVTSATYKQVSSSEFQVSVSSGETRNPKPETRNST